VAPPAAEAAAPAPAAAPPAAEPVPAPAAATPTAGTAKGQQAKAWLQGVDVSHYQPNVKWEALTSTAAFVFVKATESTAVVDSHFTKHWSGARKAGLPRGAYHFFHPKEDVDKQVANFTKHLKSDPGELPPVVDVEQFKTEFDGFTCEQLAGMLQRFSQGVEKALGRKPMIYTNHVTWSTRFCDHPYFVDHPLWLAAYTHQAEPKLPKGWKRWHFWQYTENGKVAGIDGQVDQSYFNGSSEELKALFAE
jgi:lysozyme